MITCKFTEVEILLMKCGIKYLYNYHPEVANAVLNEYIKTNVFDTDDILVKCSMLIGNLDSLLRNK